MRHWQLRGTTMANALAVEWLRVTMSFGCRGKPAANKHRMNTEISNFAARLRESILSEGRVPRDPESEHQGQVGKSRGSSLRDDAAFNFAALELFALQFQHNDAYRKICERRLITPETVEHWTQIPAVPTAAFKELEMTCLGPAERAAVFHSSGTTGQKPSRHFHNAESLAVYEDSLWPWFKSHVLWSGDSLSASSEKRGHAARTPLVILTPPPVQAPHSSLVHMFEIIRQKLGAPESAFVGQIGTDGSWTLDFDVAIAALRHNPQSAIRKPQLILGTAFSFVHLVDYLAENNLRFQLPAGSRVMETGGYKNRSRSMPKINLHEFITERLGVPPSHIICEYGMSELSSQAYDGVTGDGWRVTAAAEFRHSSLDTRHFFFPPWARVQIVSPETGREVAGGETGLICVFDLANVFSAVAIQTEDLGIRRGEGFELIGRAQRAEPRGCSLMTAETRKS